jgi:hypothetical protein
LKLNIKIISLLILILVFSNISIFSYAEEKVVVHEITITDTGVANAWTNSKGVWIKSKDMNNNIIRPIPAFAGGGGFDYTFKIPVPSQYVGKITGVEKVEYNINSPLKMYCIKEKWVHPETTYSFGDNYIQFTMHIDKLESNGNKGKGKNIREDWQAPLVVGRAFYVPTKITFKYIEKLLDPTEPDSDPYVNVWGNGNPNPVALDESGKGRTNIKVNAKAFDVDGVDIHKWILSLKLSDGTWQDRIITTSSTEVMSTFKNIEITGHEIFDIKATAYTDDGNFTDTGTVEIFTTPFSDNEEVAKINPDLHMDPHPREIVISKKDFDNNVPQSIKMDMDASKSTATNGIGSYLYRYEMKGRSPVYSGWKTENKITLNEVLVYPANADENKEVEIEGTVAVKDTKGVVKYGFDEKKVRFTIQITPPKTDLNLPKYFYPREVVNYNSNIENKITWEYNSDDNLKYDHSVVSLYKLDKNGEFNPVFENQEQIERELIVEGSAEEIYCIKVSVFDELGQESKGVEEEFIYIDSTPIIKLSLDYSKTNEKKLGINVVKLTPQSIESIIPTVYTGWMIKDKDGNVIKQGGGKVPDWVDIDERFGNAAVVTQFARNIINKLAYDKEVYVKKSSIGFTLDPALLYERELTKVKDLSKDLHDKTWNIKNVNEDDFTNLTLDSENRFTKEEGRYNVRLIGNGHFPVVKKLYQYSNDRNELNTEPKELNDTTIKDLHGINTSYVKDSIEWNGDIERGRFNNNSTDYNFRRNTSYYIISTEKMNAEQSVEFLDVTPKADFSTLGVKKMYKKITLDGSNSINVTDPTLQVKYPIDFTSEKTKYIIEPLTGFGGTFDSSLNKYIKGEGRSIENGKVVFKGKKIQDIRFDQDMYVRIYYTVFNGLKSSEYTIRELYVEPETGPTVDINVKEAIVYRDPDNELKSKLDVAVTYYSDDDEIDLNKSILTFYYDDNNDSNFNDEPRQYIMKDTQNIPSYVSVINKEFGKNEAKFSLIVDNAEKNIFGRFKFDFEAIEKPSTKNFNLPGDEAPILSANTFNLDNSKKVILIDNQRPMLNINLNRNTTNEVYILDFANNITVSDINAIMNTLNMNNLNTKIYYIDKDGIKTEY